jgi:(1->4)-alpha-D-glucan 1-alpha-D-glucosylmutase
MNRAHVRRAEARNAPDRRDEYLLYQTLIGAWPLDGDLAAFRERLKAYLHKATREAKVHTSWIHPRLDFEAAVAAFVDAIFGEDATPFLSDLRDVAATIAWYGALNSLSQLLLKLTVPGVPDIYQGTELWDLSLVDPDNRRPVDWTLRRRLLGELASAVAGESDAAGLVHELVKTKEDGRIKLYVIRQALAFRGRHREIFDAGDYRPVEARGRYAEHLCAFARVRAPRSVLTVVPRLLARRGVDELPLGRSYWDDTWLEVPYAPGTGLRNVLTGERTAVSAMQGRTGVAAGDVLASLPVALLEGEAA